MQEKNSGRNPSESTSFGDPVSPYFFENRRCAGFVSALARRPLGRRLDPGAERGAGRDSRVTRDRQEESKRPKPPAPKGPKRRPAV